MTSSDANDLPTQASFPTITEAADLLAMLAEAPRRRAIIFEPEADAAARPLVYEYPGELIEGPGWALAVIGAGSADELLHTAIEVDVRYDLAA